MADANDMDLVREFARRNSETAFAEVVRRHLNLVYSVALRITGNSSDAQDVAQAVFVILARKAAGLQEKTVLTGWLYETTRFTALRLLRTKLRRREHEQEASMQYPPNESGPDEVWRQLAPHLEAAMSGLAERDRTLLALRFYENQTGTEAAAQLGIHEAAAHKRTARALEKLRRYFVRRGISSTTAVIAGAMAAHSVQAAPVALAKSVIAVGLAKGATASSSTLTLIKGALKIMAWTKAKTTAVAVVAVLLVVGTTTITVQAVREHETYPWQEWKKIDRNLLDQLPPQVRILPQKSHPSIGWGGVNQNKIIGLGTDFKIMVQAAYAFTYGTKHLTRIIPVVPLPPGRFDFIATLPAGSPAALQQEIRRKFGLVAKLETNETDVLLLTVKTPSAPGLKPSTPPDNGRIIQPGRIHSRGADIASLRMELEELLQVPVLDRTGLTGNYEMNATWNEPDRGENPEALKTALVEQLGLELVSAHEPLEILAIEKVK